MKSFCSPSVHPSNMVRMRFLSARNGSLNSLPADCDWRWGRGAARESDCCDCCDCCESSETISSIVMRSSGSLSDLQLEISRPLSLEQRHTSPFNPEWTPVVREYSQWKGQPKPTTTALTTSLHSHSLLIVPSGTSPTFPLAWNRSIGYTIGWLEVITSCAQLVLN